MDDLNYVCIATTGSVDSGKSTISGHLSIYTEDVLDVLESKEEPLIQFISKHPHEREKGNDKARGKTSDIGYKSITIDDKNIILIDLAGHQKYLKTTTRGVVALVPDYSVLMVGGNRGFLDMTDEHILILQKMNVPFIVNFTKEDIASIGIYDKFKKEVKNGLNFRKKEAVFINEPLKMEIRKDIKNSLDIANKIEMYSKNLEKVKEDSGKDKKVQMVKREYEKYGGVDFDSSLPLKDLIVCLIDLLKLHLEVNPSITTLVSTHFKVKKLFEKGVKNLFYDAGIDADDKMVKFGEYYLRSYTMVDKALIPRQFIDDCFRLARFTGNNDFKRLTERMIFSSLDLEQIKKSLEESKPVVSKEKNKLIVYNRALQHFNKVYDTWTNFPEESIKKDIIKFLKVELDKIIINSKYVVAINSYIESDADISKESLLENEAYEINEIIQNYGRNKEVQDLPVAIRKVQEFMIDPNRFPVIVTSCKTGYYLETYRVILSKLEKKKKDWKDTEPSMFSVESVINLKNSKKTLPFKGFIVSGIVRGKAYNINDEVLIGPYEGNMVKATVKSMHNSNKQDTEKLVNTERGCFGILITDERYKNFTYKNARKGMVVIKPDYPDIDSHICWQFTCNIEISSKSKITVKNGTQPVLYLGNIRQTVQFVLPKDKIIKSGEDTAVHKIQEKDVVLRFTKQAEFVPFDSEGIDRTVFLISEGVTKGRGVVTGMLPAKEDPNNFKLGIVRKSQKNKEKENARKKPINKGVSNVI